MATRKPLSECESQEERDGEAILCARIRAGDEAAYNTLVRTHAGALGAYAELITRSAEAAEEIVQDVFFAVWRRRQQFVVSTSVRQYLYGAVRNRALNVVQQSKRHAKFRDIMARETLVSSEVDRPLTADAEACVNEIDAAVRRAVDRLPVRCREAYTYRVQGMSNAEIAEQLGIAVKTVEAQVTKALKVLRERLARHFRSNSHKGTHRLAMSYRV